MGIPFHQLTQLLRVKKTGEGNVPYMGYVKVQLQISEITAFNEILLLVIEDNNYCEKAPVQNDTLHINRALDLATEDELKS